MTGDTEPVKKASTEIENIVEMSQLETVKSSKIPLESTKIGQLDITLTNKKKSKKAEKIESTTKPIQKLKCDPKTQKKESKHSVQEVQFKYPAEMKEKTITGKKGGKLEGMIKSSGADMKIDRKKEFSISFFNDKNNDLNSEK